MTRYPNDKQGDKWNVAQLKAIPTEWNGDTLNDTEALFGKVRVSGFGVVSVRFMYAFKWQGNVKWRSCGTFPNKSLAEIRKERDHAKKQVEAGIDPRAGKKAERIEAQAKVEAIIKADEQKRIENKTFKDLFDVWIKDGPGRADGNKYIIQTFSKHAIPALGSIAIRELSEQHLRAVYRSIIASGRTATAVELSKDIGQMLRWAEKRKPWRALMIDGNPSELVEIEKLVPTGYIKERTRLLSVDEIKKLKFIFDNITANYSAAESKYEAERPLKKEVQLAMWLCLSTLCRIGELLMTEWKHVDFKARTWFIPAENTKGKKGKKRAQLVYLSDFALTHFEQLHSLTGDSDWVFPAKYKDGHVCLKSASKQIGDRQMKFKQRTKKLACRVENNSLVLGDVEWTPHDLRRTGSTMMQELKISRDVINLCQNHFIGSKLDSVYLLYEYADQKREAWYKLGDRLEAILSASNVVSLKSA